MSAKLKDKVALVTGASKGIGAEIAIQLASEGARVIVNYSSDQAGATKTVKAIEAKGSKAVAVQANVRDEAGIEKLFAEADKAFGQLDILVNNAGIFYMTPLEEINAKTFDDLFHTNVLSMLLASKQAARRFPSTGGVIINLSSIVASKGFPGSAVYAATKGAIDSMTRVLSAELGPKNIRVNAINPGLVITEGTETAGFAGGEFAKMWSSLAALGRAAVPSDIASVAVFLASNESGWLTGETIQATGGVR